MLKNLTYKNYRIDNKKNPIYIYGNSGLNNSLKCNPGVPTSQIPIAAKWRYPFKGIIDLGGGESLSLLRRHGSRTDMPCVQILASPAGSKVHGWLRLNSAFP